MLETIFNTVLKDQANEQIGAEHYERSDNRQTYRNGYRSRQLTLRAGTINIRVPKLRNGTFTTDLFANYARSEQALLLALMEMVIQGVSARKVTEITEILCGAQFSKSTVSMLCEALNPIVNTFRNRSLKAYYPFLIVDSSLRASA